MKFIFYILTLLFVNSYLYSKDIDSADADFCLSLGADPKFLLIKQNNNLLIRTGEEPIECESTYRGYGVSAEIDFIDKSGKSIILLRGVTGTGWGYSDCCKSISRDHYLLSREIQIKLPQSISQHLLRMSQEEKRKKFRDLLQFKDKIIDGYITVFPDCKPHELEYKTKFRARITGECDCDFLKERALRWNIEWIGCK